MKQRLIGFVNKRTAPAVLLSVSLVMLIMSFLLIVFKISDLTSPLILHFDFSRGVDRFGEKTDLWFIWFEVFLFVVVNTFLSYYLFFRERAFSYIFLGANVLLSLLLFIALATIVSIN
jgi:hypothetical protein